VDSTLRVPVVREPPVVLACAPAVSVRLPDEPEVATLTPASGIPATATVSAATVLLVEVLTPVTPTVMLTAPVVAAVLADDPVSGRATPSVPFVTEPPVDRAATGTALPAVPRLPVVVLAPALDAATALAVRSVPTVELVPAVDPRISPLGAPNGPVTCRRPSYTDAGGS